MKRTLKRGTIAVACGVMLVMAGGTPATAKPMKPAQITQYIFKKAATYKRKTDMRPFRVLLTKDTLSLKGRCDPHNKYNPVMKSWANPSWGTRTVLCDGRKISGRYPAPRFDFYKPKLRRLAKVIAGSAGVSPQEYGEAKKIAANKRKATIWFSRTGSSVTPSVSRIVFRAAGRPIVSTSP